jgi:hypothetical protein
MGEAVGGAGEVLKAQYPTFKELLAFINLRVRASLNRAPSVFVKFTLFQVRGGLGLI